jgi:FkbM family methyltransferase
VNSHPVLRKYLQSYREWGFRPPRIRLARKLTRCGSEYGGYFVDTSILPQEPIVYSAGIGLDISFDLSLIGQYGCSVHAFDPTPRVQSWLASQSLPPQFRFHPLGIADLDGSLDFFLPSRADFVSHSMVRSPQYSDRSISMPVIRLTTAMTCLRHNHIDVLKMDIEGGEYSVLKDLIQENIPVNQLCVEFHHRVSVAGVEKTRAALSLLTENGFAVTHICPRFEVFSLIRTKIVQNNAKSIAD